MAKRKRKVTQRTVITKSTTTFGAYAVRVADAPQKSKWSIEIHKKAAAAVREARDRSRHTKHPVCVFDLSRWTRRPVCYANGKKTLFGGAPHGLKVPRPGGKLKRLALEKSTKMPIVKED